MCADTVSRLQTIRQRYAAGFRARGLSGTVELSGRHCQVNRLRPSGGLDPQSHFPAADAAFHSAIAAARNWRMVFREIR